MIDTDYQMLDVDALREVVENNPDLLPDEYRVDEGKDLTWNREHISNAVTNALYQGSDIDTMTEALMNVTQMNWRACRSATRTAMTCAQNSGRMASYKRAENIGVKGAVEWMATLDNRTRDSHRQLDGETVSLGEEFSNGLRFPGDPDGARGEVCNCRCTTVYRVEGVPKSGGIRQNRSRMSYEEWKGAKGEEAKAITEPQRESMAKQLGEALGGIIAPL